jgi:hypothetical protein
MEILAAVVEIIPDLQTIIRVHLAVEVLVDMVRMELLVLLGLVVMEFSSLDLLEH